MNTNIAQGNWSEIKGKIKTKWAKLTDNDVDSFKGNMEQLAGKLESIYGHSKEQAAAEYQDFIKSLVNKAGGVVTAANEKLNNKT